MTTTVQAPTLQLMVGDEMISDLASLQGLWTSAQYLRLTNDSNWLIEFTNGELEILPFVTERHQEISGFLLLTLHSFLHPRGGTVLFAPLRLQVGADKFREPDLLVLRDANDPRRQNAYWRGADLVMEIVSPDNPERDTVVKRLDYAQAGIPEYWIVHPEEETITVLRLAGDEYAEHGVFHRSETATSLLLDGFAVAVDEVLDAR